jgi:hypothetical protein
MLNKPNYSFYVDQVELVKHTVVQSDRYYDYGQKKPYGRWRHNKDINTPHLVLRATDLVDVPIDQDNYDQIRDWTNAYWSHNNNKVTTIDVSEYVPFPDGSSGYVRKTRPLSNQELYEVELEKAVAWAVNKVEDRWATRLRQDANLEFNPLAKFLNSKKAA